MALKTNFTDDILAESMNGKRQYNVTENSNGTKSLEDVTDYQSVGSTFSAKDMNETNAAVNQAYDDMGDEFNKNTKYLAGAVKIHNNKLWKFKVDHDPGEWDESQVRKTTLLGEIGELNEKLEVDKIIMDTVLVTFVNGVGTVTYDGKGYSKAICTANFMADAAYPPGYYTQLGVYAENGIINFYTSSTSNGEIYVSYSLGLKI